MPTRKTASYMQRQPIAQLEDLRDDTIAVAINSGQTFKSIHERGGPTPQTIAKWLYRETKFPQLATVRAILQACDHDLTIAPKAEVVIRRFGHEGIKYPQVKKKKTTPARRRA